MLLPFIVALQLHAAAPSWKVVERTKVAWRAGATPYEVLLDVSGPTRYSDGLHRIRVRVPGRQVFSFVGDSGVGPFVAVREELYGNKALIPPALGDSARVLILPLHGAGGTAVFAVFWSSGEGEQDELTLIGFDATGNPRLLFRRNFLLKEVTDLDGDGVPEIVGRPTISEVVGKCATSYDPYAVYRVSKGKTQYDLPLSKRYNEAHYAWAGPKLSVRIAVKGCAPGPYHAVPYRP